MRMFFTPPKTGKMSDGTVSMHSNLHIVDDNNQVLSLSGDNSCGALPLLERTEIIRFKGNNALPLNNGSHKQSCSWPTPVEFLEILAHHLGYTVTPK